MRTNVRSGLTLIELSIAATLFALIAGVAGQSLISGTGMSSEIARTSNLTEDTNRVLQRIAGQLRSADYNWIYLNQGSISTYTFRVCTGLGMTGTDIGPRFDHTYTVSYNSLDGTLTATLVDQTTGSVLNQEIARDLRTPDGFRVGQLGTDVLVKGNQLQLTMARYSRDDRGDIVMLNGVPRVFESATTIFLRSTIYANTNLTTTATDIGSGTEAGTGTGSGSETGSGTAGSGGTGSGTGGETPATETATPKPPTIALGNDTDTSTSKHKLDGKQTEANNIIILGSVTAADAQNPANLDSLTWSVLGKANDGVLCSLTLSRGWVKKENPNGELQTNQFKITGWVIGSLTLTVTVANAAGYETTVTQSY